jgi:hypothetical protein
LTRVNEGMFFKDAFLNQLNLLGSTRVLACSLFKFYNITILIKKKKKLKIITLIRVNFELIPNETVMIPEISNAKRSIKFSILVCSQNSFLAATL